MVVNWGKHRNKKELEALYRRIFPTLWRVAAENGYALAAHGSFRRDFDLIAVPWRKNVTPYNLLAAKLHKSVCGVRQIQYEWEEKPHGRKATVFPIAMNAFIDLSVCPATK